jgi:hypothetical protein
MRNRLSRFVQRSMGSNLHLLQVGEQHIALFAWQSQQDFIVHLRPIHAANCWLRSRFGDTGTEGWFAINGSLALAAASKAVRFRKEPSPTVDAGYGGKMLVRFFYRTLVYPKQRAVA